MPARPAFWHLQGVANGRLLDADYPVPLIDLPPLDLPPLRTHARFMAEHHFDSWLEMQRNVISDNDLRRWKRRQRDRERREAKR